MAQKKAQEAQYAPPASQVDLEERLASGNASHRILSTADIAVQEPRPDDVEGYINVDPIYQNHANDTEAPLQGEEGPEAELEKEGFGVLPQHHWETEEPEPEKKKK